MAMHGILKSIHGRELGLSKDGVLVAPGGYVSGSPGSQIFQPSPTRSVMFDDFNGAAQVFSTTITEKWRSRKGTTNAVDWTTGTNPGGSVVGTIGDTTASMAVSGVQLDAGLNWKADQGDLYFEARVRTDTITSIAIFIGLTNQVGALMMPIQSAVTNQSADTITTNATDAVGFLFDTGQLTARIKLVGVAADVDATSQNTGVNLVVSAYKTFAISISATGVATFFLNGIQKGTAMTGAVTAASTPLTPVIAGFNRTTSGTPLLTCDYIGLAQLR